MAVVTAEERIWAYLQRSADYHRELRAASWYMDRYFPTWFKNAKRHGPGIGEWGFTIAGVKYFVFNWPFVALRADGIRSREDRIDLIENAAASEVISVSMFWYSAIKGGGWRPKDRGRPGLRPRLIDLWGVSPYGVYRRSEKELRFFFPEFFAAGGTVAQVEGRRDS